jgi:hypothetical protein
MYNYGGYNQVCFIGGEITDPGRNIPRSILLSTFIVAALYMLMTIVILGMIPWQEVRDSRTIASLFIERTFADPSTGRIAGIVMTTLILFVAAAGLYATILGYSRVAYAAARDGDFFKIFAHVHPTKGFPDASLVMTAIVSIPFCFLTLGQLGELADPGADPAALHLAVRGGDPAAEVSPRHPATVHDVALPLARDPIRRALGVHLLHRPLGRNRVFVCLPANRHWGVQRLHKTSGPRRHGGTEITFGNISAAKQHWRLEMISPCLRGLYVSGFFVQSK